MLIAVKGNREEVIEEKDMTSYSSNGYDVYENKDGKLTLKVNAINKKVSYEQHKKVLEENKKLKAEIKKLKDTQKEPEK